MRQFALTMVFFLIIGCHQEKENIALNDRLITPKNMITTDQEPVDSLRDPYSPYYLMDKNIKEIGQMVLDNSVRPTDNDVTFRIMDSLLAKEYDDRRFYFKVYVKILDMADGALAEAIGLPGLRYVEKHTKEFIGLSYTLTNKQLDKWANSIGWEILYDSQQDPIKGGEKFITTLISNSIDLDSSGKKQLDNFNKMIMLSIEENKENE